MHLADIGQLQPEVVCPRSLELVAGVVRADQLHLTSVAFLTEYLQVHVSVSARAKHVTRLHRHVVTCR